MDPIGITTDPEALRSHGEQLHRVRAYDSANSTFDQAVRGFLTAGRFGDAISAAYRAAEVLSEQRDYRAAHVLERRAWHLAEGTRAMEDAADAWDLDRSVAAVQLTIARERFLASGYDEAIEIADDALAECGGAVIDLPALHLESDAPSDPAFRD
jgi:tetratricopeptide (TPR) repeat protein